MVRVAAHQSYALCQTPVVPQTAAMGVDVDRLVTGAVAEGRRGSNMEKHFKTQGPQQPSISSTATPSAMKS